MRPQGRGPRVAVALSLALALAGLSVQVATADDDTNAPTRQQVREAREAVDAQKLDVAGVQAALDDANQRLTDASIRAAQAAEAFNGARYEAGLARDEARRTAAVATEAADEAERQLDAYRDTLVSSYTHGSSLGALSAVVESEGLSELVQRSATMRNSESAMDARYDDLRAAQSEADDAADEADVALEGAEEAADRARDLRDAAQAAADDAAAAAQDIAGEKTELIARLAELKGISVTLAERRRSGIEARAAALAAEQAQEALEQAAVDPEPPARSRARGPADRSDTGAADPVGPAGGRRTGHTTDPGRRCPGGDRVRPRAAR